MVTYLDLNKDSLQKLFEQLSLGQIPKHVEDNLMMFREDPTYLVLLLEFIASPSSPAA